MAFTKKLSMPDFKISGSQNLIEEKKKPETVMFEYIRDPETKEKIGLFYSDMIEDQISIGFSVVHKPDVFNFERGMKIAKGRAKVYVNKYFEKPIEDRKRIFIPSVAYPAFIKYIERCRQYYKKETFCEWINNGYYLKVDLKT
jgi:hypothetical protein